MDENISKAQQYIIETIKVLNNNNIYMNRWLLMKKVNVQIQ